MNSVEQDDLESRGPLPGMHACYSSQTKYITLSNQNGTISLFKEITYLSKVPWAYYNSKAGLSVNMDILTRFNKIAIQGTPQMAVDKEAICLSRVYSYYPKCNFPLFYV